jgi:hypothetical protein
MRWIVIPILLLCGCLTQQTITEKYVCQDGSISGTAGGCAGRKLDCPKCVCPTVKVADKVTATELAQQTAAAPSPVGDCEAIGCPAGSKYVSSKTSEKYHTCACQFAGKLSAKNRVCYATAQEAEAAGKQPCGICIGKG